MENEDTPSGKETELIKQIEQVMLRICPPVTPFIRPKGYWVKPKITRARRR